MTKNKYSIGTKATSQQIKKRILCDDSRELKEIEVALGDGIDNMRQNTARLKTQKHRVNHHLQKLNPIIPEDTAAEEEEDEKPYPMHVYQRMNNGELLNAKIKLGASPNNNPRALVLFFEGYGSTLSSIKATKEYIEKKIKLKVLSYGEDPDKESLDHCRMLGILGIKSPIKSSVKNFIDRAYKKFTEGSFEKVICVTHSLGAYILSEVLAEMNDRYKANKDKGFEKFYQSFSEILLNRPFVSNQSNDLKGWFATLSYLPCKYRVETNKKAIAKFVKNNKSNIKPTFILSPKDETINYQSQLTLIDYFENGNIIEEIDKAKLAKLGYNYSGPQDILGHNNNRTMLELFQQQQQQQEYEHLLWNFLSSISSVQSPKYSSMHGSSTAKSATISTSEGSQSSASGPRRTVISPRKLIISSKNSSKQSILSV